MKLIKLTQGKYAQVDDEDFEYLSKYRWAVTLRNGKPHQVKGYLNTEGVARRVLMHRLILNAQCDTLVDHKDHNPLNNLRSNLRLCSHAENSRNRRSQRNATSKYIGVYIGADRRRKNTRIRASITINKKTKSLGSFKTQKQAALAYDLAAQKHYGEFANLNFPGLLK